MGARMFLEMARRGHSGDVVALEPVGSGPPPGQAVRRDRRSVDRVGQAHSARPAGPDRTPVGRTALLLQFSATPWRLPADLVLQELRNFAGSPSLDEAVEALVHGPKQQGAPAGSLRGSVVIGWGRNDRVTAPSQAERAARCSRTRRCTGSTMRPLPALGPARETERLILDSTG